MPGTRTLAMSLLIAGLVCGLAWWGALAYTGDQVGCRWKSPGSFCVLQSRGGAGVSIQLAGGRLSVWKWRGPGGEDNRRVWPPERGE